MRLPAGDHWSDGNHNGSIPLPHSALVVDADNGSSSAVCGHLTDMGYTVRLIATGVGAVIAARQSVPQVIFVAMQLRDVTGAELVEWLRANPKLLAVPIVAMHSLSEDAPDISAKGFNACLKKPTTALKIVQAIQDACREAA